MTVVVYNQIAGGSKNAVGGAMDATPAEYPDFFGYFWDPNVFPAEITFSRASTATYIDKNGVLQTAAIDTPRITHDPATLQCLGYLHEAQTTNLALRSAEMLASPWVTASTGGCSAIGSQATAPDGSVSAVKILPGGVSGAQIWSQLLALGSGQVTLSCYLKAAGYSRPYLQMTDLTTGDSYVEFNLDDGTITGVAGGYGSWSNFSASIEPAGGGWYRCALTATKGAGTDVGIHLGVKNASSDVAFIGDGTSGILAWGAQLETNAAATSYIPTTSAAVVRAADFAYIDVATHLAGLSQTDSTFYAEFQPAFNRVFDRVIGTDSAGAASPIYMTGAGAIYLVGAFDGATELLTPNEATTARNKAAASFRSGARTVALEGQASTAATNASGAWTRLYLGSDRGIASFFTGLYREVKVWKRGFSAAETQALTQ